VTLAVAGAGTVNFEAGARTLNLINFGCCDDQIL